MRPEKQILLIPKKGSHKSKIRCFKNAKLAAEYLETTPSYIRDLVRAGRSFKGYFLDYADD